MSASFARFSFEVYGSESKLIPELIKYVILLTWLLEFVIKSNEKIEINDCDTRKIDMDENLSRFHKSWAN